MRDYEVWDLYRQGGDVALLLAAGQVLDEATLARWYPWLPPLLPAGAGLYELELVTDCRHLAIRQAGAASVERQTTLLALLAEPLPEGETARRWYAVHEEREGMTASDTVCREEEVPVNILRLVPGAQDGCVLGRLRLVTAGWRLEVRQVLEVALPAGATDLAAGSAAPFVSERPAEPPSAEA